jgi:2-C-methyl-D-erythritol 4-phosphate cytidylyltransferase
MSTDVKKYALIVAGGKGLRMGADLPKQFLLVEGRPLLMRTLEAFYFADPAVELIVVLPEEQQAFWKDLCQQYQCVLPHRVANGGAVRYDSVKNGLTLMEGEALVAVHDGVRPFITPALVARCFEQAAQHGAVIPVCPLTESLRRIDGNRSFAEDRSLYRSVQTPQTFQLGLLKKAYQLPYREAFTDDASVAEAAGYAVKMVDGLPENIKITTPMDLLLARQLIRSKF